MIGVGKAKQYANVLDKPLSRGRQEVHVFPTPKSLQICTHTRVCVLNFQIFVARRALLIGR
jgi:hypothetical protein